MAGMLTGTTNTFEEAARILATLFQKGRMSSKSWKSIPWNNQQPCSGIGVQNLPWQIKRTSIQMAN
jgi:hypothetical protein